MVSRVGRLTPGLVRDVREEGGDLAPAVGPGREVGVRGHGLLHAGPAWDLMPLKNAAVTTLATDAPGPGPGPPPPPPPVHGPDWHPSPQ